MIDICCTLAPLAMALLTPIAAGPGHPVSVAALLAGLLLSASIWMTLGRQRRELLAGVRSSKQLHDTGLEQQSRIASQLRTELDNLRGVLDAADTPMLVLNSSGQVSFATLACAKFFDKSREALIGRTVDSLFTHAQVIEAYAKARRGQGSKVQIRQATLSGPSRTYMVTTTPPSDASQQVLIMLRDVTELAATAQLRSDFVAAASHELRTPLASIRAAVDTLEDGAWEDPTMRERLVTITQSNIARLEALLRDLLDLSRLEYGTHHAEIRVLKPEALISRLVEDFEPLATARGVTLAADTANAPLELRTQPRMLDLILRNLIDNATKFAYKGTTVRIVCESALTQGRPIARIMVIDQGTGIPLTQQPHIFERFYQIDSARSGSTAREDDRTARRGTGLGLALARESAAALGGTIFVQSIWKQGTTMTVEIPCELEAAPATAA